MGFSEAIRKGLSQFYSLSGRASISEFWWYYLFCIIIAGVLGVIGGFVSGHGGMEQTWVGIIFDILSFILGLSLAFCAVRRLHDIGKSGWNIFWNLIPLFGFIYLVILWCRPSQPGPNKYGPEPGHAFY